MCYIDAAGGIQIGYDVSVVHSTTIISTEYICIQMLVLKTKDVGIFESKQLLKIIIWINAGLEYWQKQ